MKTKRSLRLCSAITVASLFVVASIHAQPFGQWDFNSSNLTATVGSDLTFLDGTGGATDLNTAFGTNTSFGISAIGGTNAIIMRFPAATNGMGYNMPTPAANGGGSTVNQYTYILDVFYPAASSAKIRPLIRTYALGATEEYLIVDATGAVGPAVLGSGGINGPFVGGLQPDTWIRLGVVVTAGGSTRVYTNGVEMGSFTGGALNGFLALDQNSTALILATTGTNAALGYVNSIQLRDVALSAGQMAAIGPASAAGIPTVIPPVPSFIASRTPGIGATGVSEEPVINVVLDQGDTTITGGSVQLYLDGAAVGTVTPTLPTYAVDYTVPPRLDPLSTHTLKLTWNDSVVGNKTNTWTFTVKNYQVVILPAPFYFQDFDSLTENATNGVALPSGWSVQNQTAAETAGFDLANRGSDSYKDWILITASRFSGWDANRTALPTIILNGTKLTTLASGNLLWTESDSRCGGCNGQFSDLFTGPISCTGRSNVFVAFKSIYMQNQDNMNFMEYSVDGGVNWLPVLYYFMYPGDAQEPQPDIIYYTNGPLAGTIDVTNTFGRIDNNRNWSPDTSPVHATNYGSYIKAPINNNLIPAIMARLNDDNLDGKRIEVIRLAAADNKADVRFRLNANGTSSWFWGIDDFGLYEITTPVFTTQPANATVAAGTGTNFTVVVSSPTAVSYQWQHAGTNVSNSGHYSGVTTATLTVSNADPNDAGSYRCKAVNASGPATSNPANLTVVTVPTITTQPNSAVVSDGYPVSFSGVGFGGLPLTYQWRRNGTPVGGNSTSFSLASAHVTDAGDYTLVVTNSFGSVTSRVARLSVVNVPVTNGLVVHLKFDGDYTDSSGHGNNGTPVGSPAIAAGKIGSAMQYTDADGGASLNYVTMDNPVGTHPADLRMGTNTSFSVSFWYKVPPGNRHGDPALVSNKDWDSGGNTGFVIFNSGSGLQWNYTEVNDGVNANSRKDSGGTSPGLEDGNWHHCLVSFQRGGGAFAYVDGSLVKYLTLATANPAGGNFDPTTIDNDPSNPRTRTATGAWNIGEDGSGLYTTVGGGHDGPGISVTNAMVDDLGIWRRAVSPQETLAIYNGGQAGLNLAQLGQVASGGILTATLSGPNLNFSWVGATGLRLQKSVNVNPTSWSDVIGTTGASAYSEPATNTRSFYRLFKP
jgi:hypothetical protein